MTSCLLFISLLFIVSGLLSQSATCVGARVELDEIPKAIRHIFESDLDTWEAPKEISAKYPYYLSGYDEDNRPIWVIELGRYDFRDGIERGGNYTRDVYKYIDQFLYRVISSIGEKPTPPEAEKELIVIADMDGFSFEQLATPQAIAFQITTTRKILQLMRFVNTGFLINVNFVAQTLLNIVRPIYGPEFNRFEIYGTNAARWRSALLKRLPQDQLPPHYGGSADFRPVRVYG